MLPALIISHRLQGDDLPPSGSGRHRAPRGGGQPGTVKVLAVVLVLSVACLVGSAGNEPAARANAAPAGAHRIPSGVDGGTVPSVAPPPGVTIVGGDTVISGTGTQIGAPNTVIGGGSAVVAAGANGIPGTVLAAYQHAAGELSQLQPLCHLPVALLAGIGKVESGHARGGDVDANGTALQPILGPVLDGADGTAAIRDTDGGALDGNAVWDRAVGPMQFIPSTWRRWGSDGNGDGRIDPENVFDAALTAGRYLCADGRDLSTVAGVNSAVLSYNNSTQYLQLVRSWMAAYSGAVLPLADDTSYTGGSGATSTGSGGAPGQPGVPVTGPGTGTGTTPPGTVTTVGPPTGGAPVPPGTTVPPPGTTAPPTTPVKPPTQPPTQPVSPPAQANPLQPVLCGLTGVVGGVTGVLGGLLGAPQPPPDPNCQQEGSGG